MKITLRALSIKFIIMLAACSLTIAIISPRASAVTRADWDAARIIDDSIFFNPHSMSANDIQRFLNAKVPVCDTNGQKMYNSSQTRAQWTAANGRPTPPYTCLKDYVQNIPGIAPDTFCSGSVGAGTKSAAIIIKEVALACNINPQVILVTLQKEQGFITDDWPWPVQYTKATGMGCPDTSLSPDVDANQNGCYDEYEGFFKQIYYGARQFQRYVKEPHRFNYAMGRNSYVAFQANAPQCGGTHITPLTKATAALYNYTPYQPNAAALNNMYGTGDACSAYGNRNFWRTFSDWFGMTRADDTERVHPDGTIISDTIRVFIMENGQRRHITNPYVFASYGYDWKNVIDSTTGDRLSVVASPINTLAPGTLFRSDNTPVYVMDHDGAVLKKRHVSLNAFNALGYKWEEVMYVPPSVVPVATHPSVLNSTQHPSGSLILAKNEGRIYLIEQGMRRYIVNPAAFESHFFKWTSVKDASSSDMALPLGQPLHIRKGTIINSNGLFLIDYDASGAYKRPFGPWECYSDRMHYSNAHWINAPASYMPTRNGSLFTC